MIKRLVCIFTVCLGLCMAGCGSSTETEETVEATVDNPNENESVEDNMSNDDEIKKFASGVSTEEIEAEESNNTEEENKVFLIDGNISEKCPEKAVIQRPDIKYGSFVHETYYSETCKRERGFNILLPATYSTDKSYPVLYLLHGIFGDENSMTDAGNKVKEMLANLSNEGVIDEMIVVCPHMYATDNPELKPGFNQESILPYDNFINDLINDLMPYIENNYSASTGRENTLLAGFSMGGRETLYIAVTRPELFGYVCAISPAPGVTPGKDWAMSHPGQLAEEEFRFADDAIVPDVFMICCGTKDSVVGTFPKSYHEILTTNGVDHIWYEITGADHDTTAIRSGLYNLFMQTAYAKLTK